MGLTYGGEEEPEELNYKELNIYCDADWASDADRKSVSGYVITLAGGAVAWSSKKQSTVALSTVDKGTQTRHASERDRIESKRYTTSN